MTALAVTVLGVPVTQGSMKSLGPRRLVHSNDAKQIKLALTETRGKKITHVVKPLADAPRPKQIKPNVEALIENAQEARDNADLDQVARAAAGLTGDELDAVKAVVTARRAELKETAETAEPTLDGVA